MLCLLHMYSGHTKFPLNSMRSYMVKCSASIVSLFFSTIVIQKPDKACHYLIFKDGVSQAPLKFINHNH